MPPVRIRDTVYVIGAGFSAGLGYPLTKSLLIEVWGRLNKTSRNQLREIITFHHPAFDPKRKTSFPDIEQLLTEVAVNLDLFDASHPVEGKFTKLDLQEARGDILSTIGQWFHEIYEDSIIFNWDLVLDQQLFGGEVSSGSYGLTKTFDDGPVLLKPHGSLNWYEASQMQKVAEEKHVTIFKNQKDDERIEAFLYPREIKSKSGRRYTPLIIPPTYLKDFQRPVFRRLWNRCTDALSTPKKLIFLGYSLPAADLHAQFIFRCGFHNQIEGRLKNDRERYEPTGPAELIIVNPDQEAARRIESVAGPKFTCNWVPKRIQDWVDSLT